MSINIPIIHVKAGDDCSICLDGFAKLENLVSTNCGHIFHKACVETHMQANQAHPCPLCNRKIENLTNYQILEEPKIVRSQTSNEVTPGEPLKQKFDPILVELMKNNGKKPVSREISMRPQMPTSSTTSNQVTSDEGLKQQFDPVLADLMKNNGKKKTPLSSIQPDHQDLALASPSSAISKPESASSVKSQAAQVQQVASAPFLTSRKKIEMRMGGIRV